MEDLPVKKKLIVLILFCIMIFTPVVSARDIDTPVTIYINGEFVYSEVPAVKIGNYNYVALRPLFDVLGAESITYRDADKSVTIIDEGITLQFIVGKKEVYVDGFRFEVDFETVLYNGKIMAPLEFVSENYGLDLAYEPKTCTVFATKSDLIVETNGTSAQIYSTEDVLWLARIVRVEVGYQNNEAKLAVANVVLNRKKSPQFPGSIKEVIFQKGQFPPAYKDGFAEITPTESDIYAAKLALSGVNNIETCLFFNHRKFASKEKDFYKHIDGEYFYY